MTVVSCLLFCGIKFALCELGRPPIWLTGGNRCIRAYRGEPVHLWQGVTHQTLCQSLCAKGSSPLESLRSVYARTQENGKISLYRGCSFIGEYGILGLVQQIRILRRRGFNEKNRFRYCDTTFCYHNFSLFIRNGATRYRNWDCRVDFFNYRIYRKQVIK